MRNWVSQALRSRADRTELQEIKREAEKQEFDILLVFMFDRLGRKDNETPFVLNGL